MDRITMRLLQGPDGLQWLVTFHANRDGQPARADRPDITYV